MAITVQDIQEQSFSIDRKGYDVDEVDVFLEHVADEIGAMIEELDAKDAEIADLHDQLEDSKMAGFDAPANIFDEEETETTEAPALYEEVVEKEEKLPSDVAELQAQVADLKKQLAEKTADSSAISAALVAAQRTADDIVSNAKVEANRIVKDANIEADRIVNKAENDRNKIQDDIEQLQDDRDYVCDGYRDVLTDFINDAQRKLEQVNASYSKPIAGHARQDAFAAQQQAYSQQAGGYKMPIVAPAAAAAAPAEEAPAPKVYSGEKDLSGFGDADDDFDFDDPE